MMFLGNFFVLISVSILSLWVVNADSQTCKYTQFIAPGRSFAVNNPGHPGPYGAYASCSWDAYTSEGANVEVECSRVDLAKSSCGMCMDYLTITMSGSSTGYCAPFKVSGNRVQMTLRGSTREGGYFNCVFRAVQVSPPPTLPPSCDCGWNKNATRNRVAGGVETKVHEFPSMCNLVHIGNFQTTQSLNCGGTIISYRAVLTAGHCTYGQNPAEFGLLVGEHDYMSGNDTSETQLKKVAKFITHPYYDRSSYANDVALVIPESPISFTENVGPACLPFLYQAKLGSYLTIVGFGTDSFGGSTPQVPMKADLRIVPHPKCARIYGNYNPANSVCTYRRGKDACQFDSGGPLYSYNSQDKQFVMAIVSEGRDCGRGLPAVHTRVTSYLEWIQRQLNSLDTNVTDEEFCWKPK